MVLSRFRLILGIAALLSVAYSVQYVEMSQLLDNVWNHQSILLEDEYQALLHKEKSVLRSGPGGLDWGNHRLLQHAAEEQDRYVEDKNKMAMVAGRQVLLKPYLFLSCL